MLTIDNPCIRRCTLNEEDICLGCFRSFDDMRQWHKASREEKTQILLTADKRKEEHKASKAVFM